MNDFFTMEFFATPAKEVGGKLLERHHRACPSPARSGSWAPVWWVWQGCGGNSKFREAGNLFGMCKAGSTIALPFLFPIITANLTL